MMCTIENDVWVRILTWSCSGMSNHAYVASGCCSRIPWIAYSLCTLLLVMYALSACGWEWDRECMICNAYSSQPSLLDLLLLCVSKASAIRIGTQHNFLAAQLAGDQHNVCHSFWSRPYNTCILLLWTNTSQIYFLWSGPTHCAGVIYVCFLIYCSLACTELYHMQYNILQSRTLTLCPSLVFTD